MPGMQSRFSSTSARLFNFNNPLGALSRVRRVCDIVDIDMNLVVPDRSKSIREGAIAPWNSPSYRHELDELMALAEDYDIPVDVPFSQLSATALKHIQHGVKARKFGGLDGFFAWLERRKYKMHIRVLLSRYRSYRQCPTCRGQRLKPEALAYRVDGKHVAEIQAMRGDQAEAFFGSLQLAPREEEIGKEPLRQIQQRLGYLRQVGLSYLQIDRTLRTLSGGEANECH